MHPSDYAYYDTDPTQPTWFASIPKTVYSNAGGGPYSGSQWDFPPPFPAQNYQYASSQPAVGSSQKSSSRQGGGMIGELPTSSGNQTSRIVPTSSAALPQRVARLRLAGPDSGNPSNPNQLTMYRQDQPKQGGQVVGQFQLQSGRPSSQSMYSSAASMPQYPNRNPEQQTAPPIGASGSFPSRASMPASMGKYPSQSHGSGSMGPPIGGSAPIGNSMGNSSIGGPAMGLYRGQSGQPGQQGFPSQPMIGRMQSSVTSVSGRQQITSPFVPASTSHPIGGPPSQHMSMHTEDLYSSTDDMMQQQSTGNLSNLGSVSQWGMSQAGSFETKSPVSHAKASNSLPPKIKAVCSSGGHFLKLAGGGMEYKGGETRLIQVPNFCRYQELLDALERIAGPKGSSNISSGALAPSLKYQLPAEPDVYVDLVDDEDTQLMFDEWHEYSLSTLKASSAKLHLFVDWLRRPIDEHQTSTTSSEHRPRDPQRSAGSSASADELQQTSSEDRAGNNAAQPQQALSYDAAIADRMEVISPDDVSLVKFLGSGGYGEVYLGKWQSSEAAIKCLNPSLFFTGGTASVAATNELIREAALLGSLRHPNVVWVYGIVLPQPSTHGSDSDDSEDSGDGGNTDYRPPPTRGKNVPQQVRPPAMVTEYMSQGSVKGALQRKADIVKGALMRVLIAMDAAKGMEYLHSKKIVHFDLKSANLLLGWRDRRAICKVADFGLSKQKRETFVSNVTSQRGTLPWIAPEIIKNPTAVTEKVDVFSFGVVLWELWTGKEPYDGLNYHALLHQMTVSDKSLRPAMPGSSDWDPSVGPEPAPGYQALMERCWSDYPAGRPSFPQIVKALKDMASSLRSAKKSRPLGESSGSLPQSSQGRERDSRIPQ